METIFIKTENSRAKEPDKFRSSLADKRNLKDPNKNLTLANLSTYYTWKNIKSAYNNKKFKITVPTLNDEFNLSDGSYSISDIQDNLEYIIKKHANVTDNASVQIYINQTKNRIAFKINTGYKLELLSTDIMKLLEITKKDVEQNKDGENVPKLESVEVILVHCNLVNNNYQQASKVLFTFVPNKQFDQLITIAPHLLIMLNTTNTDFSSIETWFTNQNRNNLK